MRHFLSLTFLCVAFGVFAEPCEAIPVYLRPGSRFPSGHHTRQELENRTRKIQFQEWVRIQTDDTANPSGKIYGWLPEEHLVMATRLATEADIVEATPLRYGMQMDAIESATLLKGTHILINNVQGSWVRAETLPPALHVETWVPTSALRVSIKSTSSEALVKIFVPAITPVFVMPGVHARVLTRLQGPTYLSAISRPGSWLEVNVGGEKGYLRRADAVSLNDLGTNGARAIADYEPLRSAPLPYADLVRSLSPTTHLKVIEHQQVRWGSAKVADVGEIWWPMSTTDDERFGATLEKISTPDLFQRKIFAMASSPAIPALKFISAEGIFRTVDGEEWSRIPLFENKNYPIAVAGSGSIFVGPYISDDHGETFQQWIRWDTLVATLKHRSSTGSLGLRILEIHPQDPSGRHVMVKVNTGAKESIRLVTTDQGISWQTL